MLAGLHEAETMLPVTESTRGWGEATCKLSLGEWELGSVQQWTEEIDLESPDMCIQVASYPTPELSFSLQGLGWPRPVSVCFVQEL